MFPISSHYSSSVICKQAATILVSGLSPTVRKEQLLEVFGNYGPIRKIKMPKNHNITNVHAKFAYAYIRYNQVEDSKHAIQALNGAVIGAYKIGVRALTSTKMPRRFVATLMAAQRKRMAHPCRAVVAKKKKSDTAMKILNRPPTPYPSRSPTPFPSRSPTPFPSRSPTPFPSRSPTPFPSRSPTPFPSRSPTPYPSRTPTPYPSRASSPYPSRPSTPYHSRPSTPHAGRRLSVPERDDLEKYWRSSSPIRLRSRSLASYSDVASRPPTPYEPHRTAPLSVFRVRQLSVSSTDSETSPIRLLAQRKAQSLKARPKPQQTKGSTSSSSEMESSASKHDTPPRKIVRSSMHERMLRSMQNRAISKHTPDVAGIAKPKLKLPITTTMGLNPMHLTGKLEDLAISKGTYWHDFYAKKQAKPMGDDATVTGVPYKSLLSDAARKHTNPFGYNATPPAYRFKPFDAMETDDMETLPLLAERATTNPFKSINNNLNPFKRTSIGKYTNLFRPQPIFPLVDGESEITTTSDSSSENETRESSTTPSDLREFARKISKTE